MTYFVDTGDERNKIVKDLLTKSKKQSEVFSKDKLSLVEIGDAIVFSPAKKWTREEIESLPQKISVFAGSISEEFKQAFLSRQIIYHNLLDNEIFAVKNANLTAEGVLALIIEHSPKSIFENNILILGAGRIAKALAIYLGRLGVKCAMVRYNEQKFPECYTFCEKCYLKESFFDDLNKFDVIVNTIPQILFDEKSMQKIARNTIYIETASINSLNPTRADNFIFVHAPALPQRYCKETAAKIMLENILGENKNV